MPVGLGTSCSSALRMLVMPGGSGGEMSGAVADITEISETALLWP